MGKYWIVKNTVKTTEYVKKGYAAIGWSECEFDVDNENETIKIVESVYGTLSGRDKGVIHRFISISEGDTVLVPCYKGFYMGHATGEYRHLKDCYSDDRANIKVVNFEMDEDGEPHVYPREGINTALSTKIGSRHLLLEIYDENLTKEVDILLKQKKGGSIENRIRNLENKELDILRSKVRDELNDYRKSYLDAKGKGFEELISILFRLEGYETHILSKKSGGSGIADADILAIRRSKLSPKLNEVLYIQAKHHTGITGTWGYKQIKEFKSLIEKEAKEKDGNVTIKDENGNFVDIESNYIKYVLISSAEFDSKAYEENEKYNNAEKDEVILIDGEDLSGMIIGHIDELDTSILSKLGLMKKYVHIDDYKHGEVD